MSQQNPVVTGCGVLSPLGTGRSHFHSGLLSGLTGFVAVTRFDTAGLGAHRGGELTDFDPAASLGAGNFRPLDRTGLLATAAARLALDDAGFPAGAAAPEIGLVLGTMFGSLKTIAEFDRRALVEGPIYAKPMDFANSVINAAAGQAAIWHRLPGANATISGGPAAGLAALVYAGDLLRQGQAEILVAGGADEMCFESFLGFDRRGELLANGADPKPFGADRRGFLLGEGAGLLVLETAAGARARGARVHAELLGSGNRFDPSRGSDAASAADAAGRAMTAALAQAGLAPEAVDVVSAAANGSPRLDRAEAVALGRVFGARAAHLPIVAVKAQTGEALGASGAFQTLALLTVFETGTVPGIRGLDTIEAGLPIDPENGWTRPLDAQVGLVHAASMDGQHVALVIGKGTP